jgi:hypothetical protein
VPARLTRTLFAIVVCATPAGAQVFTVVNSSALSLTPGHSDLEVYFKVATPEGTPATTPIAIKDLTKSFVDFTPLGSPTYEGGNGQTGFWRTAWQVTNLKEGVSESRALLVTQGKATEIVPVTFSRKAEPDFQATVTGPGAAVRLGQGRTAEIRIVWRGPPTRAIPSLSTLADDKTGHTLQCDWLELVSAPDAQSGTDGIALGKLTNTVYLRIKPGFDEPGKYMGNVSLSTPEKPDLGNFALTVYSTNTWARTKGVVLIAAGLAVFFSFAVWAKSRSKRIQAILPAARLSEEVARLIGATEEAKTTTGYAFISLLANVPATGSLRTLAGQLKEAALDARGFLPPKLASPFAAPDLSAQYQSFLLVASNQVNALGQIVSWGIASVERMWPDVVRLHLEAAGTTALVGLDGLANFGGPPEMLRSQIQTILTALENAIAAAHPLGGGALPVQGTPTSRQLTVELEELSAVVWAAWAALTIFTGACALVLFNDGFGTGPDMVQCFLWGVGLPSVANGFGALSASSVTSTFAVQIPR